MRNFILIFCSVLFIKQNKQDHAHAPRVHRKYVLSHNDDSACFTLASILRRNTGDGSTSDQASPVAKAQGKSKYQWAILEATQISALLSVIQILNCICVFNFEGFDTLLILLKRAHRKRKINQVFNKGHVFQIKIFVVLLALITIVVSFLSAFFMLQTMRQVIRSYTIEKFSYHFHYLLHA